MADRLKEWLDDWNSGTNAEFQVNRPNPKLVEHYDKYIQGKARAKIFFPLCGDTWDMKELASKGHEIIGVECSDTAIKTFFSKHKTDYTEESCDKVKGRLFKSKDGNYRLYCCDLFNFNVSVEGQFDAIVDFGSMGALLKEDLQAYADLMKTLMKPDCRHILETFLYDTKKYPDSRPHCFSLEQLQNYYGDKCIVEKIDEGPNPYAEEEAESKAGHEEQGGGDGKCGEGGEEFPEFIGAAYFLIKPK